MTAAASILTAVPQKCVRSSVYVRERLTLSRHIAVADVKAAMDSARVSHSYVSV